MSKEDIAAIAAAAVKLSTMPAAPVHKMTGPSDKGSAPK